MNKKTLDSSMIEYEDDVEQFFPLPLMSSIERKEFFLSFASSLGKCDDIHSMTWS